MKTELQQINFDPFGVGRLHCPSCADGRLIRDRIHSDRVCLACDTCDFRELYDRDPQTGQLKRVPITPLPSRQRRQCRIQKKIVRLTPYQRLSHRDYQRWNKSGRPPIKAFIAAGCPTPKQWREKQSRKVLG